MSQELLEACGRGDLNQVKILLTDINNPIDIHYQAGIGMNALINACIYGYLDIVKYLLTSDDLKEHANIHHKNNFKENALMYACAGDHFKIIQYLIIEQNMNIDNETMEWLIERDNYEVLDIIKTRDLYNKMNENLTNSDKIIKSKKI